MTIIYMPFAKNQEKEISALVRKVYDEFVARDNSADGNQFFYDWIEPSLIAGRQEKENSLWVATDAGKIVGMIETRLNNRVSLLFVSKEYQGNGIARRLFLMALEECKKRNDHLALFHVHASPFSIPFYQKLGFVETDLLQENNGILYMPMEMDL